jgi:hypothetical protein
LAYLESDRQHTAPPAVSSQAHDAAQLARAPLLADAIPASDQRSKDDAFLARSYGTNLETPTNKGNDHLDHWDNKFADDPAFRNPSGPEFKTLVANAAKAVGIDPGLLAANALTEVSIRREYQAPTPINNMRIGLDTWADHEAHIKKEVSAVANLKVEHTRDFENNELNEGRRLVNFPSGPAGLLAMAAMLKHFEIELERKAGPDRWMKLPDPVRFELIRLQYNPGKADVNALLKDAVAGKSIIESSGPTRRPVADGGIPQVHPQRAATVMAAQAAHLSQSVFGNDLRLN